MKTIIMVLFVSMSLNSYGQSNNPSSYEIYLYGQYFHLLAAKTVMLEVSSIGDKYENFGGGFLVEKGKKFYLVTNYHIIPSYDQNDTTLLVHADIKPTFVEIRFHSKIPTKHGIVKRYQLYNSNGKRLFYTVANQIKDKNNPRAILDISILPLGGMDNAILIDTVQIWDKKNDVLPNKGNLVSIWGFRNGQTTFGHFPITDTGVFLTNSLVVNGWKPIIIRTHRDLQGDSGSPVYIYKNKSFVFMGMDSAEGGLGKTFFDYDDLTKTQNLVFVVPKKIIRYAIERFTR